MHTSKRSRRAGAPEASRLTGRSVTGLLAYSLLTILATVTVGALSGCASHKILTLMPTPVLYRDSGIDPFVHLAPEHQTTTTRVFYATNRKPVSTSGDTRYSNDLDKILHLGTANVRIGDPSTDWETLTRHSLAGEAVTAVPLRLETTSELAVMAGTPPAKHSLSTGQQAFVNAINEELAVAVDKEIMLYVHGTKVDFYNAAVMTAEIDHFAGRDFVGIAFSWPSHQNILNYVMGTDVHRALDSSPPLQDLLALLADHTHAEKINILSYSAGGRVTSRALSDMRRAHAGLDAKELRNKFRLGSVVFAAADVSVDVFLDRLLPVSDIAGQVVVTISDNDSALRTARLVMGGTFRAGTEEAEVMEETFIVDHHLSNVELVDVSFGQTVRGFDIAGHHYWYRHPWMSSDIIFLMRTDLPAGLRGLSAAEAEGLWYLSPDYPEKIRRAAETALRRPWGLYGPATRPRIHAAPPAP